MGAEEPFCLAISKLIHRKMSGWGERTPTDSFGLKYC